MAWIEARVPRSTTAEIFLDVTPGHHWPASETQRRNPWHRLANRVYRLFTPDVERASLANFSYVSPRLSRGAQPGRAAFGSLAALGVDTVINLRQEAPDEAALVRALGMDYLYCPLDPLAAPTHAHVLAFLRTVCDPARGHVFFHCYHGADRTGVLAACYRIAHDAWPLDRALEELADHHFHHAFQPAMWAYVRGFKRYWDGLPVAERAHALHQEP